MNERHQDVSRDVAWATGHVAPGILASAWTLNGFVAVLTCILITLQIGYLIWKWNKDIATRAADKAAIASLMRGRVAKPGERAPE